MNQEDIFDMQKRGREIMQQNLERAMAERCGIQHKYGGQRCDRTKGHPGPCRCKASRVRGGSIMSSEWMSEDGEFLYHIGYTSIYPVNAGKGE